MAPAPASTCEPIIGCVKFPILIIMRAGYLSPIVGRIGWHDDGDTGVSRYVRFLYDSFVFMDRYIPTYIYFILILLGLDRI